MDLKERVQTIANLIDRLAEVREEQRVLQGQIEGKMQEARELIKQGQATGDPITDFLIVRPVSSFDDDPSSNKKADGILRSLMLKTSEQEAPGQLVLLVQRVETAEGCPGKDRYFQPENYQVTERLSLGLLDESGFVIEAAQGECGFSCSKYVSYEGELLSIELGKERDWGYGQKQLKEGLLSPCYFVISGGFEELGQTFKPRNPRYARRLGKKPILKLEVAIGNRDVMKWFMQEKSQRVLIFGDMLKLLGVKDLKA